MSRTYLFVASFLCAAAALCLFVRCSSPAETVNNDNANSGIDNGSETIIADNQDPDIENENGAVDGNSNENAIESENENENENDNNDENTNVNGTDPEPNLTFVPFQDEAGAQLYLEYVQMIGGGSGYGAIFPLEASEAEIYETRNNAAAWSSVNTVQTGNTGLGATWWMHVHPDVMAVATAFSGFGVDGTLSVSFDDGRTWAQYEEPARGSCEMAYSEGIRSFVVFEDTWQLTLGESANHAVARQGPVTATAGAWSCADLTVSGAFLASTDDANGGAGQLFMWAYDSSSTADWNLYWWDGGTWIGLRPHLPVDFWLTAWATAKSDGTITLIDAEGFYTPAYSALTIDSSRISDGLPAIETFYAHGAEGDEEGYYLTRAIQQGDQAYVCVKNSSSSSVTDIQLNSLNPDTGVWETVVHEEDSWSYRYYFQTDYAGRVYAIRWGTYLTGFYDLGPAAN